MGLGSELQMELKDRLKYAKRALDGIALGDCFGESFFVPEETAELAGGGLEGV